MRVAHMKPNTSMSMKTAHGGARCDDDDDGRDHAAHKSTDARESTHGGAANLLAIEIAHVNKFLQLQELGRLAQSCQQVRREGVPTQATKVFIHTQADVEKLGNGRCGKYLEDLGVREAEEPFKPATKVCGPLKASDCTKLHRLKYIQEYHSDPNDSGGGVDVRAPMHMRLTTEPDELGKLKVFLEQQHQ